jgi:hypothetical protein
LKTAILYPLLRRRKTFAGRSGRIIRRANETRIFFDVRNDFGFIENVIAGSHQINTGGEKFVGDCGVIEKPPATFSAFIKAMSIEYCAQIRDFVQNGKPSGTRDDIGDN